MDYNKLVQEIVHAKRMLIDTEEFIKMDKMMHPDVSDMMLNSRKININRSKDNCCKLILMHSITWTPKMDEYIDNIIELENFCNNKLLIINETTYDIEKNSLLLKIEKEKDKLYKEIETYRII